MKIIDKLLGRIEDLFFNREKYKSLGYTHVVKLYGFKCYYSNCIDLKIEPFTWFADICIGIIIIFDYSINDPDGFLLEVVEEL